MTTKLTNFPNGIRVGGGNSRASASSTVNALRASFNPTSATQILLGTLPAGSRVVDVQSFGGATGGTNPTVDVGTSGTTDGFANELLAASVRSAVASTTTGSLIGTLLSTPTPVYGKVGASAATGGATVVMVQFTVEPV